MKKLDNLWIGTNGLLKVIIAIGLFMLFVKGTSTIEKTIQKIENYE